MVVLAQPRDGGSGDVKLEEDDVIEYVLEKPYGEVLGCTLDSSTLNRSLSARVRRRERVRDSSLTQFTSNVYYHYQRMTRLKSDQLFYQKRSVAHT